MIRKAVQTERTEQVPELTNWQVHCGTAHECKSAVIRDLTARAGMMRTSALTKGHDADARNALELAVRVLEVAISDYERNLLVDLSTDANLDALRAIRDAQAKAYMEGDGEPQAIHLIAALAAHGLLIIEAGKWDVVTTALKTIGSMSADEASYAADAAASYAACMAKVAGDAVKKMEA